MLGRHETGNDYRPRDCGIARDVGHGRVPPPAEFRDRDDRSCCLTAWRLSQKPTCSGVSPDTFCSSAVCSVSRTSSSRKDHGLVGPILRAVCAENEFNTFLLIGRWTVAVFILRFIDPVGFIPLNIVPHIGGYVDESPVFRRSSSRLRRWLRRPRSSFLIKTSGLRCGTSHRRKA